MGFGGASTAKIEELIQAAHTITNAAVAVVGSQTDKLAGEDSGESSVLANWQSGTATSTETGADLVTIGASGEKRKVHSLVVDIGALTVGATITIKLFAKVNGVEKKIYPPSGTTWVVGTEPAGVWVINGTLEIDGALRCECQSDKAGDNGKAIAYKYSTEAM
ncbi:hypothetical protein ES703_58469 [subsurface metagenome]